MNLSDLTASLEQHKGPALAAAGAGVVLLALRAKRKAATTPAAAGATSTTLPTAAASSGYSAGAQLAGTTGAAYDSTSTDLYGALSPQLASIGSQLSQLTSPSTSPTPVPAPMASTLLTPTYDGSYWHMGSGMGEFESDGSMLVYTADQWANASKNNPGTVTDLGNNNVPGLSWTSTTQNAIDKNKALTAASAAKSS